jgi:hypothetical protein
LNGGVSIEHVVKGLLIGGCLLPIIGGLRRLPATDVAEIASLLALKA